MFELPTCNRCNIPVNWPGTDVTCLTEDMVRISAAVAAGDEVRCMACVRVPKGLPDTGLSPCGDIYQNAAQIAAMVETPAWLQDYIDRTTDASPSVWHATTSNGYSKKIRTVAKSRNLTADSRQPTLTASQKAALAAMLSGDADVKVDSLMSLLT